MHLIPLLLFVLWMKPGLILTPVRVNQLFDRYAAEYFSKRPETLKLEIRSPGILSKHFLVEATGFCIKDPEACFKIAHAEVTLKVTGLPKVEIREIGPIEIRNESVKYTAIEKASPTPKPSPAEPKQRVTVASDLKIHPILVDFPQVEIRQEEERILGQARIEKRETDDFNVTASASSNRSMKLDAHATTRFAYQQSNPVEAKVVYRRGTDPVQTIDGSLNGDVNWQTLRGEVEGEIELKKLIPWVPLLAVRNLKISRQEKLHLQAGLDARLEPEIQAGSRRSVLPPAPLSQNIKGKIDATENEGVMDYSVSLHPTAEQGIVIEGGAVGHYPFGPGEKTFYGVERLGLRVAVPDFQKLVQRFKPTSFAIPAPFSAMGGSMEFLVGDVDKKLEGARIPLKFDTRLTSSEQAIVTLSGGWLEYVADTGALKIDGQTHIKLIKVTMPDLKVLEPIPLITYDKRIVSVSEEKRAQKIQREEREKKTEEEARNEFHWKMTSEPGGIQIFHPILKPHAPIDVNWELGDHPRGEINLRPFVIDYLNRPAKVMRMRFYQDPKDLIFKYDGRLMVKKTDYTIFIDVFKVAEKPKIELTSSPPLSEEDIISVLLFNDVTASLDQDQSSSVGSTQSAIANRALGLFSILALSSTPIEAVNYNAATGVYSARVRLASGLTATVGTNWDQTQEVALRKRLGRNFVLSTVLQSPSDDSEDTQKTMLEWFRRF